MVGIDQFETPEAVIHSFRSIGDSGLKAVLRRALHERLLLDKNLWSQHAGNYGRFGQ